MKVCVSSLVPSQRHIINVMKKLPDEVKDIAQRLFTFIEPLWILSLPGETI